MDVLFGTVPKNAALTGKVRRWPVDRGLVQEIRPDLKDPGTQGTTVAYIPQHDLFYEMLTLREHLEFQVKITIVVQMLCSYGCSYKLRGKLYEIAFHLGILINQEFGSIHFE